MRLSTTLTEYVTRIHGGGGGLDLVGDAVNGLVGCIRKVEVDPQSGARLCGPTIPLNDVCSFVPKVHKSWMSISNADGIGTRFITKVFGSARAAASVACVIFIRPGPGGVATPPDTHTYFCPPPCRPGLFEVLHDHRLVTRSKMKAPHKPPN